MTLVKLRPHQAEQAEQLRRAFTRHWRVIAQAPPGVGKTILSKWMLGRCLQHTPKDNQTGRFAFLVHRRGLVDQAAARFEAYPELPHGIIMSGRRTNWRQRVQVGSIDTVLSWLVDDGKYRDDFTFDLIVFDECHSHLSKLQKFVEAHNKRREAQGKHPALVLGLSATPQCKGIGWFQHIVPGPPVSWLVDKGWLVPYRYVHAHDAEFSHLKKSNNGEFTRSSIEEAFKGIRGDLVADWKKFASGLPTVGFFPTRSAAQDALERLRAAGISAAYVDGQTPDEERDAAYRGLEDGSVTYVCNVMVIERGTDIPAIKCIQLCTSVGTLARYLQMIGRGSRPCEGKTDCLILDHGGNVGRMALLHGCGFFDDPVEWTLDWEQKAKEIAPRPTVTCPNCGTIYRGGKCSACEYEPTPRHYRQQGLQFEDGELVPVSTDKKPKIKKMTNEQIMLKALYRAGNSRRSWRQAIGLAYRMANEQGTRFRVPKSVTVGDRTFRMLTWDEGSRMGHRYVSQLFPWTESSRRKLTLMQSGHSEPDAERILLNG